MWLITCNRINILSFLGGEFALKFNAHYISYLRYTANMNTRTICSYEEAVYALNGLQSNAASLQKACAEKDKYAARNLEGPVNHLKTLGVQLSDLDSLNIIHVAGTKGKGSTCAFSESILRKHGYKTGFYCSPHLVSVNERIRINGLPLDKSLFAKYFWEVYNPVKQNLKTGEAMPPYFQFLTVMAFYVFLREKVEATVIEVGIGGLYDCTNIVKKPVVTAVTSLGIDHVHVLGNTLPQIAAQKAGIFKPGVPVFTVCQHESAMKVLYEKAQEKNCLLQIAPPLQVYDQYFDLSFSSIVHNTNASLALQLTSTWLKKMSGVNDMMNMQIRKDESKQIYIPMAPSILIDSKFKEGLETCIWRGRFQIIEKGNFTFYLDGAHTQQSIKHCIKWFQDTAEKERRKIQSSVTKILLFNCTGMRKAETLLDPLSDINFDLVIFSPNRQSVLKDSSSDLSNFMVDPQQEIQQCITNKEVWGHLMRSLAENELSMSTQNGSSIMHHEIETTMLKEGNSILFCCLGNAINWILHQKEMKHCMLCDKSNALTHILQRTHIQILVTGSLHLVGGVLALIEPESD